MRPNPAGCTAAAAHVLHSCLFASFAGTSPLRSCQFLCTCPAVASREGGFVVNQKMVKKVLTFSYVPD
jgi:hypothetical protein